jgi:signal transduction histidine kinase
MEGIFNTTWEPTTPMATMDHILTRIEDKKVDYTKYGFTRVESNALKTFLDLAQEFDSIDDVYRVSVAIPLAFFKLNARLYIVDPKLERLALVSSSTDKDKNLLGSIAPSEIRPADQAYSAGHSMVFTIRGNKPLIEQLPFTADDDVIGILELYPCGDLDWHRELFFQKYANRIGFSVHMRFLLEKNIEHVKFIQSLVADIEHNVIVPNMVYKLFLRRLRGKILKNREIEELVRKLACAPESPLKSDMGPLLAEIEEVNRGLEEEFTNIEKHYQSASLFLETLLRRSHFDEGRLTLSTKACNIKREVIEPQLERFAGKFAEKGIAVEDHFSTKPAEDIMAVVDVGLVSQVYANFLSNTLKYAHEVVTETGERKKYMAYGGQVLKDFFGPEKHGIKCNVFSTGSHIPVEERENIFEEGFRGSKAAKRPGSGHGLAFVKNAIEIHGGVAGYEPAPHGNNFYFIVPE